jgi:hypothetical protein
VSAAQRPSGEGWIQFGWHADPTFCDYEGPLDWGPDGEDGLPDWERHADQSLCTGALLLNSPGGD